MSATDAGQREEWRGLEVTERMRLSLIVEPGDLRVREALDRYGAAALLAACVGGDPLDEGVPKPSWVRRATELDRLTQSALDAAERTGLRWVQPGDAEWPSGLAVLDNAEPLSSVGGAPLGLWARGPLDLADGVARSVAIVGARNATTYGNQAAGDLAAEVAVEDHTVISGGAFGIDVAAHRGALAVRKPTICVLACGADVAYPRAHGNILARIADGGLVLSEQAPGETPTRGRFLTRNRIIAALAQGTVVVEAARRSGALNTVNWAQRCGRVAMGVPGPVTSRASVGVHDALRSGGAVLVTRSAEVLEAIGAIGSVDATLPWVAPTGTDRLSVSALRIFERVPAAASATTDAIASAVPCRPEEVRLALGALSAAGFVVAEGDGWRALRPERRADLS
ncbi:DNA-processing protein DprA [Solicola gregarius]|uniref:DNA-processing protein DprA n=1 Tax=Solicola gregarius TaxID=2908642 RepID=A0AA46TFJ9_9ACTN|nr:DNA-processing protein DprA [Solicola gregarius]UYM04417.1 DNA-processing protein DprA [Solicola gregarius]